MSPWHPLTITNEVIIVGPAVSPFPDRIPVVNADTCDPAVLAQAIERWEAESWNMRKKNPTGPRGL